MIDQLQVRLLFDQLQVTAESASLSGGDSGLQLEPLTSSLKVTLCNNLTLFEIWFYRQLVLVPSSNSF